MATKKVNKEEIKETTKYVEEEVKPVSTEKMLQRIFYCLVVIACTLIVATVGIFIGKTGTASTEETATDDTEYDVSMFKEVTADEFVDAFNGSESQVIYIGRATCGYCKAFLPALQEAQDTFGYKTLYLDIESVSSDDVSKITVLDSWLEEYYGTTPLVVVVKDGKIQGDGWVGYADYDTFADYLKNLGFEEK